MPQEAGLREQGSEESPDPGKAFESPPAAPMSERAAFDPRARLHEIALALVKTRDRRLLVEYLQLRRATR